MVNLFGDGHNVEIRFQSEIELPDYDGPEASSQSL